MESKEFTVYAKKPIHHKQKRGFTDRMYLYNVGFVTAIVFLSFVLMFISAFRAVDTSPLTVIVPAAFTELGIHTAFVVWKAKAENLNKHPKINEKIQEVDSYVSANN